MNSKGQSALEYLMTYGWALVVIVIVVAALFAFGVFNTPANCTQFGGRLLLKDYAISAGGISVAMQNGSSGTMTGISGAGTGFTATLGKTTLTRSEDTNATFAGTVAAGSTYKLDITYTANGIVHTESTTCVAGTV